MNVRYFYPNSLATKITTLVLLTTSVTLIVVFSTVMIFDRVSTAARLQSRLAVLTDVLGQNSAAALTFDDQPAAEEVLEALRKEQPLVAACLYNASNDLFASYHRPTGITLACPKRKPVNLAAPCNACLAVRPVFRQKEFLGTLYIVNDGSSLRERRNSLLLLFCILALGALLIGGACGLFLQRRISKPFHDLSKAMRAVTKANSFTNRVRISGPDEIAELGMAFNSMIAELERRAIEKRMAEEELQYAAHTDSLTGLPNRRFFAERLAQALQTARQESRSIGLLYIDLDGFKLVNDSFGHGLGDLLLIQVGSRLRSKIHEDDLIARVGGDEFTVILESVEKKEDAAAAADILLESFDQPFIIEGREIIIGGSIGISLLSNDDMESSDLLRQADNAMYAAKRSGRNQAVFFRAELGTLARERLDLEGQLRGAIARGEIAVHYQPEFDVRTGNLVRFEALVRWMHPVLGSISPAKFIPIAEESGMINRLGAYVMETACKEACRWQTVWSSPIQVAVNVSSIQFNRDDIVEEVSGILSRTGLNPSLLQIELTETVMVGSIERTAEKMRRLKALGVNLAIDDFGTGYSCLSYLSSLPFHALKIDRAFISNLNSKKEAISMVRSLIGLAHNLDMRVIVEGVEKFDQMEVIRELNADEVQGFLLGMPSSDPLSYLEPAVRQ